MLQRKKLMADHQRRIQDELSRKKTEAMNDYLDALSDDEPDVIIHEQPNVHPFFYIFHIVYISTHKIICYCELHLNMDR